MEHFITDLDNYIAKNYDDFNVISALEGFLMIYSSGLKRVYTTNEPTYNFKPDLDTYCILNQKNSNFLLSQIKNMKKEFQDIFSVYPVPLSKRIASFFNIKMKFGKALFDVINKYGGNAKDVAVNIVGSAAIFKQILLSRLYPSKLLLFKLFLALGINQSDVYSILNLLGYAFNTKSVPELIIKYLIEQRIFSFNLIDRAFKEYNISFTIGAGNI